MQNEAQPVVSPSSSPPLIGIAGPLEALSLPLIPDDDDPPPLPLCGIGGIGE